MPDAQNQTTRDPARGTGEIVGRTVAEMQETTWDVIIIGAGIAGLAAGHALLDDELDVLVLEAKDRLGGRIHTDRQFAGFPVELGAEFIHGERSATWRWVDRLGLATAHWTKLDDSWVRLEDGRRLTMRKARQSSPALDITRSWNLENIPPRPHETFGDYLRRIGFDLERLDYVRRAFANAAGESMRFLDATATLHSIGATDLDGEEDYRILEGFGAIIEALGIGLDIHTRSQVARIEWGAHGVKLTTSKGRTYNARTAIITIPLGVLKSGGVEFHPPLPPSKQRALGGLGMGPVGKFVYRFAEPLTPPEIQAIYAAGNPPMWWSPSAAQPDTEAIVWSALVSGDGLVELTRHGETDALERALEALRLEVGRPGLRPLAAKLVDWSADQHARGGYSHVRPGHYGARELLAEPTPPLFWAGEATAQEERAATVHGALLTGERAAVEVRHTLTASNGITGGSEAKNEPAKEHA